MSSVNKRDRLGMLGMASIAGSTAIVAAQNAPARKRLGIGMHSYGFHWQAARDRHSKAQFSNAIEFLEYGHKLGAGGVQVAIASREPGEAKRIRLKSESCGMYFEGQLSLPKDESDATRFDTDIQLAKEAGASLVRTACLSGRRYETFKSAEAFREFKGSSWKALTVAEPILKRHRIRLAIENHKDWLVPELIEILRRAASEWIGVCVDTGNSIALLEDPLEVVEALAPFAFSTHLKDMGVQEYGDGFLLSELPLGKGFLDLKTMIAILRKANPAVEFNLEMITRDPLKIPCVTANYWITMADARASRLAHALATVKRHASATPLPELSGNTFEEKLSAEDANVRRSLEYARTDLGL